MRTPVRLALALLAAASLASAQKIAERDLAPKYQDWLHLVGYHIQPIEKDVFLQLRNDRDRDAFIETFWKQRDPTPGTPENEYQDEIVKRFKYVNEFFGRGTTRPGWQTDMGRYYMILGPPQSIERFDATLGLVPAQAWSYYGDPKKDLPPQFVLVFFQRVGVGEYRLYDPVSDGPSRLLQNQRDIGDPFDYEALYEKVYDLSPTLAEYSLTRIPGDYGMAFGPSPRNALLLASILESPKKDVNPSYASHFLNLLGVVSTEYLTNYVESTATTALILDPATGLRFLNFSMVPAAVNVDAYVPKDQFYCNFRVDISLRVGESIIFQYGREFPLYFPKSDWDRVRASGLAIEESFPVLEGKYRLNVLLTNTVGKQFSVLEQDLDVPADPPGPSINGPFLGYKFETYPRDVHIPFKVNDRKLVTDPRMTFARTDTIAVLFDLVNMTEDLFRGGSARISVRGLREASPVRKDYTIRLDASTYAKILSFPQTIPAADLDPDYYELVVELVGADGRTIDTKKGSFVVSPAQAVGHPIANAKGVSLANQFLYRYMLAQQAEKTGRPDAARALYEQAYQLNPEYKEGVVMYAGFLNKVGDFAAALEIARKLETDEQRKFTYHVLRGQALMGQAKYEEALSEFVSANKLYNSDITVLNSLGRCYFRLGRKAEALEALKASLSLDPKQDAVKKLIDEIQK
ncbi:MAG TPA: GWxTD domain-containing protein [Acidobacteriota bacterium]|nr:GWxTD domain-containing protein [Acidobacteriota bacterium]